MKLTDIVKGNSYRAQIDELEETCTRQEKELKKLNAELRSLKNMNTKLSDTIQEQESILKSLYELYDFQKAKVSAVFQQLQEQWAYWDFSIHQTYNQLERQARACQANYTPLELHTDNAGGYFRGLDQDYWTTLVSCNCQDFQRRLMPCKHMYRLAHEFDVFMLNDEVFVHPSPQKIMYLHKYKGIVSSLTGAQKEIIENLKYEDSIPCESYIAKKLIEKGLIAISNDKTLLLASYRKDELLSLLSEFMTPTIKRLKKEGLIGLIITEHPEIITQIEKLTVPVELSDNIKHLVDYI